MHVIAAKAVAFKEAMTPEFVNIAQTGQRKSYCRACGSRLLDSFWRY